MNVKIVANCVPSIAMVFGGTMLLEGNAAGWALVFIGAFLQVEYLRHRF